MLTPLLPLCCAFPPFPSPQLNISYPVTGAQKVVEVDDDNKLRAFYDKRISHEVTGDHLGDEYKGYVFKISGGNDKQGFCMTQGILTTGRVRILMREGMLGYRSRKKGERKRKSARGCIVSSDLSVLNLVIVKKGDADIDGLTTAEAARPRRLGPKRASRSASCSTSARRTTCASSSSAGPSSPRRARPSTRRPRYSDWSVRQRTPPPYHSVTRPAIRVGRAGGSDDPNDAEGPNGSLTGSCKLSLLA